MFGGANMEKYIKPETAVVDFKSQDVITTSGVNGLGDTTGEGSLEDNF
jgi:hypothetical protein